MVLTIFTFFRNIYHNVWSISLHLIIFSSVNWIKTLNFMIFYAIWAEVLTTKHNAEQHYRMRYKFKRVNCLRMRTTTYRIEKKQTATKSFFQIKLPHTKSYPNCQQTNILVHELLNHCQNKGKILTLSLLSSKVTWMTSGNKIVCS